MSLDWEWWDGTGWRALPPVDDGTDALYGGGVVRLGRPEDWDDRSHKMPGPAGGTTSYWLRCRVREDGYEIPPRLSAISTNGVAVSQRRSVESVGLERVDPGTPALADQRYRFPTAPIQSATVTVDGNPWTEVDSLGASGPDDRHYTLDRASGVVRFGGGFGGVAPPADATVGARSVVYGGGTEGNLRDAEWAIRGETPSVSVDGRGASGGTDAETVADAVRRVRRRQSEPARAVTIADYETLAVGTPGVRISRATAHAHEGEPRVTVTVVPYTPPDCGRPEPSDGVLAAIERHLDDVRLLTDRVTVVPPRYAPSRVRVSVRCRPRYAEADGRAVETAVRAYLDPLRGDDGDGWPFGGSLSVPALRERIEALDAVVTVESLSVTPYGAADRDGDVVRIDERTLFWVASVETDCTVVSGGERP
ncbi:hypothetical protein GJ629_14410 [Halapricum sp. CBA1109]|uniref:baseplate J/gp47 family protein n=1 Tax=Halapricum sp. CBA1109 TaxID=2668068 RepID=UPI0013B96FCF|nr:hypothetical protein [Halapricum sp. CBA1109]